MTYILVFCLKCILSGVLRNSHVEYTVQLLLRTLSRHQNNVGKAVFLTEHLVFFYLMDTVNLVIALLFLDH